MPKKLLVCDDDPDLRRALVMLLGGSYDIVQASAGEQALLLIASERPSLVLLDVNLPDMTGLQVLERARARQPALPVIMLSGKIQLGIVRRALALGAVSYLTKPFEPEAVRREVRLALEEPRPTDAPPWKVQPP